MNRHPFKIGDYVIWDNDSHPEVCKLVRNHANGFIADDGELVTHYQLELARLATQQEMIDKYDPE